MVNRRRLDGMRHEPSREVFDYQLVLLLVTVWKRRERENIDEEFTVTCDTSKGLWSDGALSVSVCVCLCI